MFNTPEQQLYAAQDGGGGGGGPEEGVLMFSAPSGAGDREGRWGSHQLGPHSIYFTFANGPPQGADTQIMTHNTYPGICGQNEW